ncbi:xanthine dehydrogenase family protein molybdopterin-binding subunit [Desertibaculum subflavum]|uniref:xanthine dehydrogenase family protein molybdopterin-binding subunit n=1 Tax=Desertibaculum subflavum TaxID=2268458 RepID=UPI000E66FDE7
MMMKHAIGQPVPRQEDPVLVQGQGRYTDDFNEPGQAYAVMVRSRYAHGIIRGIDAAAALAMPGVLAVYTAKDLTEYGPILSIIPFNNPDGKPMPQVGRPALAADKVRYVGDPVAVVVAETRAQARDAAEAVEVDIDPLPSATDAKAALAPGAAEIWDHAPGNQILDYHFGDADGVAKAFAAAAHVTRLSIVNNRVVISSLEPRGAIASYDAAAAKWTMRMGTQGAFGMREQLRKILNTTADKMRVLTGNVGGSFGMKGASFPEYPPLLHAARALGRPVKWVDERSESFLSDHHGRGTENTVEAAFDKDGKILALRLTGYATPGAYLASVAPMSGTRGIMQNLIGVYATPLIEASIKVAYTNTSPLGPYRGAGRPEANYFMERLIETAAAEMKKDPIELRRINHVKPEAMPHKTPATTVYDSGEFTTVLNKALDLADWKGFEARAAESKRRGKLRGRGIGNYLEVTAPPMNEMGGIRFNEDGTVTIITGTLDYGQGHWTPFAQVLSDRLGVPFDKVRILQGDSDKLIAGGGTGGSKSIMASGAAIIEASAKVVEAGKQIAAQVLETAAADIEFGAGRFTIAGTDRGIGIMELAEKLRTGLKLPEGVPATLDVDHVFKAAPSAFPNGCHIAEVEVDPETGIVEVVKYSMVNDFGTVVNPLLVEGQAHGGVAQGIGQALMERVVYDPETGQPLTGSYVDYALPRAADTPTGFAVAYHSVPAKTNPLGAKGCGEAGCAGALPAVMNALVDALKPLGIKHIDMPATPEKVWAAIQGARG